MNYRTIATDLSSDPMAVFEQLVSEYDNCFLLETLADEQQPQTTGQSYIGVDPKHVYVGLPNALQIDGSHVDAQNPYDALKEQLSIDNDLPSNYVGGLVGYFSHEGIHQIETELSFD